MTSPRIAIIMDEDTSRTGRYYDTSKNYFSAIDAAGGLPYGIAYLPRLVPDVLQGFDGFLSISGGIAFPDAWYATGHTSPFAGSERIEVEIALMQGFLARKKPVLGICHGMQMMAALHGCKLGLVQNEALHKGKDQIARHSVSVTAGSLLHKSTACDTLQVNSVHREAIVELGPDVLASSHAPDGTIESIELKNSPSFAMGLQWHQEHFWRNDHPANAIFKTFVDACRP